MVLYNFLRANLDGKLLEDTHAPMVSKAGLVLARAVRPLSSNGCTCTLK
jgi:hypothetical protein